MTQSAAAPLMGAVIAFALPACVTPAGDPSLAGAAPGAVATADAATAEFRDDQEFRAWFAFYYQSPTPDRLTAALRYMSNREYVREYPDIASVFLTKILAANQNRLEPWCKEWQSLDGPTWEVILVALWFIDTPASRELVAANLGHVTAERRGHFETMVSERPSGTDISEAPVQDPRQINLLWAAFSATGEDRYAAKVIDYVRFYGIEDPPAAGAVGEAAIMTLANNTLQHAAIARLCQEARATHPDPRTRLLLDAMITALARVTREGPQGGDRPPPPADLPAH